MTRTRALVSLILSVAVVSGCARGPAPDELSRHVQQNLDRHFKPGLFEVADFRRMGTHGGKDPRTGTRRLLVYFTATLRFRQKYSMSHWNDLGLEALANALGAGARGIDGVKPETGNEAGDALFVRGSLAYASQDGAWRLVADGALPAPVRRPSAGDALAARHGEIESLLADIGKQSTAALKARDAASLEEIYSMVRRTQTRATRHLGTRKELVLATGHKVGTYHPLGLALARALTKGGVPCRVQQTEGSVENCKLVQHGYADLAVVQNDVVFYAHSGTGPFTGNAQPGIAALCAWFPEPVQVFVRAGGPFSRIEDLRGKRVAIGAPASGTRLNARQVLAAHGFQEDALSACVETPAAAALDLLQAGRLDAFFLTEASPARLVLEPMRARRLALLSLSQEAMDRLVASHPFYVPLTMAQNRYPNQEVPARTLAVAAILVASKDLQADVVERILRIHYASLADFIRAHPKGAAISLRHAADGLSIPRHPGAEAFFAARAQTDTP